MTLLYDIPQFLCLVGLGALTGAKSDWRWIVLAIVLLVLATLNFYGHTGRWL